MTVSAYRGFQKSLPHKRFSLIPIPLPLPQKRYYRQRFSGNTAAVPTSGQNLLLHSNEPALIPADSISAPKFTSSRYIFGGLSEGRLKIVNCFSAKFQILFQPKTNCVETLSIKSRDIKYPAPEGYGGNGSR